MFTTIQDPGRPGHQNAGIPPGGALDGPSAGAANACVGNAGTEPVLEITMTGPQIRFEGACQIAITGADITPVLNKEELQRYQLIDVPDGSVLTFSKLRSGCRAYLAVRGSWQVRHWMGSASALSSGGIDLVPGALISKGSQISIQLPEPLKVSPEVPAVDQWPQELSVHVLAGPEFRTFSGEQIAFFFNTEFTLTSDCNRVGYRLEPELPNYVPSFEMITSGIIPGTIQIARQGQPVILLADAQTTGGYPRIANVLSEDLASLAQLRPGDRVRFDIVKQKG